MTTHEHAHHGHHGHEEHGFNAESLRNNDLLYADVYAQVIDWLAPPPGAAVLEAGSGAGGFTRLLADAVAHGGGSVTALDESDEMLAATRAWIDQGAHGGSVSYQQGDIASLPFDGPQFDLVWSSRTIHHLPDQLSAVKELARVVRPGGKLALREGSIRTRFLPDDIGLGEPGLEDRIDVAFHRWFTANVRGGEGAVRYPFGWTQMLRDAGMETAFARTFLLEAEAPFDDTQIAYMGRHLKRWVDNDDRKAMLAPGDADVVAALTDASSEHFVFKRPDLHLQEMVTVYVGVAG